LGQFAQNKNIFSLPFHVWLLLLLEFMVEDWLNTLEKFHSPLR